MPSLPIFPLPSFALPPNPLPLSPSGPLQSPPRRLTKVRPPPSCTLRRALLSSRTPNSGHAAFSHYLPSVRHPTLNLHTLTWTPSTLPVAGLVIIPSLIWHAGWFHQLARALTAAGIKVVATDPLGAGRSDRIRGLPGLLLDPADHVDDACAAVDRLHAELQCKPVFVLGESAGGMIAALMMLRETNARVSGYVFCSPALRVKKGLLPPAPVLRVVRALAGVAPGLPVPGEKVSGETWDKAFGDAECAELSKRDPYVGYGQPLRVGTAAAMLGAMEMFERKVQEGDVHARNVLVAHNRGDERTDFESSERFVERVRVEGVKRLVEPGGSGHQLFQDRPEVTEKAIAMVIKFVVGVAEGETGCS